MTQYLWILGLSLAIAGSASAQAPGDEGPGATGSAVRRQPAPQEAFGEEQAPDEMEEPADEDRGARRRGRDERDGDDDRRGSFGDRGGRLGLGNAMFEAIDANGDGSISNAELRRAPAALKKLDADGDGNITLAEVGPAGGPGGRFGGGGGPFGGGSPEQMVMAMIQQFDRNRDGQIGLDEVDERSLRMLSQFRDMNEDGKLNQQELLAGVQQMQQRMGGGFGGPGGAFGGGGFDPRQMTERLMANDQNGDGKLTEDEVPPQMQRMLSRADENGDGELDAAEIEASTRRMGERFRGGFGRDRGDRGNSREEGGDDDRGSRRRRAGADE